MDRSQFCGCKGVRSCLLCEETFGLKGNSVNIDSIRDSSSYVYCIICCGFYAGWDTNDVHSFHTKHGGDCYKIPGIFLTLGFLTEMEEQQLVQFVDNRNWELSQSGRRKQNFGPKCNFKKRKLKVGDFNGFPKQTEFVQNRFQNYPVLDNYETIEQCFLEYDPTRGASIDPHIDDCWIWGNRIISVNLLSDSVLTLTKYKSTNKSRYNLKYAPCINEDEKTDNFIIRIPMPRRSLLMLYDEPRYLWQHFILRQDITERRICIAYREFTPPYLPGGLHESEGKIILQKSKHFF